MNPGILEDSARPSLSLPSSLSQEGLFAYKLIFCWLVFWLFYLCAPCYEAFPQLHKKALCNTHCALSLCPLHIPRRQGIQASPLEKPHEWRFGWRGIKRSMPFLFLTRRWHQSAGQARLLDRPAVTSLELAVQPQFSSGFPPGEATAVGVICGVNGKERGPGEQSECSIE